MAQTVKKTKAPSKPKKTAAEKPVAEKAVIKKLAVKKAESKTGIAIVKPISRDEVAQLAHRYWAERGYQHGQHVDDWFRAEQELRSKAS